MTQVNLLPPEVQERQRTRRVTATIVGGAGMALALLLFVFFLQTSKLSAAEQQLEAQQARNAAFQAKISSLQRFAELQQNVSDRQAIVDGVTHGEVEWSGVLRDISSVMPPQMWLTSFTGTLQDASTGGTAPAAGSGIIGNIQFGGNALDYPTVALFLGRLEQVNGWVNPWATSLSKSETNGAVTSTTTANGTTTTTTTTGTTDVTTAPGLVGFSGSVDLTDEATVDGRKS